MYRISRTSEVKEYAGGDGWAMYYSGLGYPDGEDIAKYALQHGYTYIYWASDEAHGMSGIYNGDTYVVYKSISDLPYDYREDAEKYGQPIPQFLS